MFSSIILFGKLFLVSCIRRSDCFCIDRSDGLHMRF